MKELRKDERVPSTGSVTYVFSSNDFEKMRIGLLSNLSKAGACIYTQECITKEKVKIYLDGIISDPISADVVWCDKAIDNLYRVGLRFQG